MIRDANIECYRVLLMFSIVLSHCIGACGYMCEPVRNLAVTAVVGFAFLSGWFSIHFRLSKLIQLISLGAFVLIIYRLIDQSRLQSLIGVSTGGIMQWWFLVAYCGLLVFSPALNLISQGVVSMDVRIRRQAIMFASLVLILNFGLFFMMHTGAVGHGILTGELCNPYTCYNLSAIYLFARLANLCRFFERMTNVWALIIMAVSGGAVSLGAWAYNSPFALAFVFSCFYFVRKIRVGEGIGRIALWMSPSLFSIYLLHSRRVPGFALMTIVQDWFVEHGVIVAFSWVATAVLTFSVCLAVDAIRRILLAPGTRVISSCLGKVDDLFEALIARIETILCEKGVSI